VVLVVRRGERAEGCVGETNDSEIAGAAQLRLLDFTRKNHNPGHDRWRSLFTLFHLYISTRDVARFGQLMLQKGEWEGRQLIPRDWVTRMTTMVTPPDEVNPARYQRMGLGFGYQVSVVGVAHQRFAGWYGRPDRSVSAREYLELLHRIVAATGDPEMGF
jgi:CubicO group peptidase (beta-lactamase class C family)